MEDDILRPKTVVFSNEKVLEECEGDEDSYEMYVNNASSPTRKQHFHWSSYAGFGNDDDEEEDISPIPKWRCCEQGSE